MVFVSPQNGLIETHIITFMYFATARLPSWSSVHAAYKRIIWKETKRKYYHNIITVLSYLYLPTYVYFRFTLLPSSTWVSCWVCRRLTEIIFAAWINFVPFVLCVSGEAIEMCCTIHLNKTSGWVNIRYTSNGNNWVNMIKTLIFNEHNKVILILNNYTCLNEIFQ